MYDSNQQIIVCNQKYAEMYGLSAEQTKAGTCLLEILEHRIAAGTSPTDTDYIESRLKLVSEQRP